MSKYSSSAHRRPTPKRDRIPPLVRGIGCLMFVLVPIVAYGIARAVVPYTVKWGLPIPIQWFGLPNIQFSVPNLPFLVEFVDLLRKENNLTVNLVFAVIITVLLYGLMTIVFGYAYSATAPSQYGPTDVPPPRVKTKKYTR
jgi:hypothetical protein